MIRPVNSPLAFLRDALQTVALQGRQGVRVDALWPLLPSVGDVRPAADQHVRRWLWTQLKGHEEMSVSLAGHTVVQIRALTLEEAGGVLITASERARMWMYGVRDGSDESLNPSEDMMKVIEELARALGAARRQLWRR